MIDVLINVSVNETIGTPPPAPQDGESYLIASPASGDWTGREDSIAMRIGGGWQYITPFNGLTVFDRATEQKLLFNSAWQRPMSPTPPSGGSVVDVEARSSIDELILALQSSGILPP